MTTFRGQGSSILKTAAEWIYFGRNNCDPVLDRIQATVRGQTFEAPAWEVYKFLNLPVSELKKIYSFPYSLIQFLQEVRRKRHKNDPYFSIGMVRSSDHDAFLSLAKLTGKTIKFVNTHGECEGIIEAIYKPDDTFSL